MELRKFVAPEYVFGYGARHLASHYIRMQRAKRVCLVTDQGLQKTPWVEQVRQDLLSEGLLVDLFTQVSPNPRSSEVEEGARLCREQGTDLILALGGGSVMDAAKGMAIVLTNHRSILEFEGVDQVRVPMLPLICIPSTAGTAADLSQFAIITNLEEKVKIAIISKAVVPEVALVDPEILVTMPAYLTACTGIDALVHAIEAYVSTGSSMMTDLHALEAIRLVKGHLKACLAAPNNLELRSRMMFASLQAGLAFSNASLGGVHAMAHSLGGLLDLPHGECNALLLPHVMEFNFAEAQERYHAVGQALGLDLAHRSALEAKKAILEEVFTLRKEVGIESGLAQRGVSRADLVGLAKKALKDACIVTNPRRPNQRDLEIIYEEAL